jgi:hypothetical protein
MIGPLILSLEYGYDSIPKSQHVKKRILHLSPLFFPAQELTLHQASTVSDPSAAKGV